MTHQQVSIGIAFLILAAFLVAGAIVIMIRR